MGVEAFTRIQIGKETTRGTAVAATKVLLGRLTFTPTLDLYSPEDEERNSLALVHRREIVGQRTQLRYDGSVTYEQVINFLSAAIKGGVTPTTPVGGTNTRDWLYDPSLTADPAPDTFTFEFGDNIQEYECPFVFVTSLEFTLALDQPWTLSAEMVGRFALQSTFTGALSAPTVEDVVGAKTKLYIDDTWAGRGTTAQSSLLLGATIRIPTGLAPVKYADGSLEFSSYVPTKRAAEVDLLYAHTAVGNTEYDKYESGALRFLRLEATGSTIEGSFVKTFTMDLAVRYTEPPELFEMVNGETALRLRGRTFHDPTSNRDMEFKVRNNITAL